MESCPVFMDWEINSSIRMPCCPKQINRFRAILVKISVAFFKETERKHSKFTWGILTLNCQNNLEVGKKETAEGLTPLDFKTRYKATVIKTVWY